MHLGGQKAMQEEEGGRERGRERDKGNSSEV